MLDSNSYTLYSKVYANLLNIMIIVRLLNPLPRYQVILQFHHTNLHLLCNVQHEIHQTTVGKFHEIGKDYEHLLDNGIIKNPNHTNYDKFIESTIEYFPEIKNAEYVGSMFTIRAVPPRADDTDEGKIRNRFNEYNTKTAILKDYYAAKGNYFGVNGVGSIQEITERLAKVFDTL